MKLIFAGTPEFARVALADLVAAGHVISLVLTRPDQPAQRGQKYRASPVKIWAEEHGLTVWQPATLRDPQVWPALAAHGADLMVVAAYGLILPPEVLAIPRWGCLNIHASLLPRWRGAAPIQRAIQAGDTATGITIMQMDAGLDTGAMRWVRALPIGAQESAGSVHDRLAALGGQAIVEALDRLARAELPSTPQPLMGVSYAAKLTAADQPINWRWPSGQIVNHVRALDPAPGAVVQTVGLQGAALTLKIWRAEPVQVAHDAAPGTVLASGPQGLRVACGAPGSSDAIAVLELQRPGARRMTAREFLAGYALRAGDRLLGAEPAPPAP